jgi:hypothetical protein
MRTTRMAVAILLLGGLPMALAVPASAHKAKGYYYSTTSKKHHHHRGRTRVRVRAPYTAVDVNTKRRRVSISETM